MFIDKLGRRYIILRTLPGVFVSCLLISLSMYLSKYTSGGAQTFGNILNLVSLVLYLAFFSIGFSGTVWAVNSEIYPLHLIGTATSLSTATNWLSNFAVSASFLSIMSTDAGKVAAFLILAFFNVVAIFFVWWFLPETNNQPINKNVSNILAGEGFWSRTGKPR